MSNKIKRNKIIIFITVLTMVISIIPINVFAEKKDYGKDKEVKISITKIESRDLDRLPDGSLGKVFNGNFLVIKQNTRALVWTNEKISDAEINILIQKLKVSDPSLDKCSIRYNFGIEKNLIIEQNKKGSNVYKVVRSSCSYIFKIIKGAISHIDYGYYEFNCIPKVTPTPSVEPTVEPTEEVTPSVEPTIEPTILPTVEPTETPTETPSTTPTVEPTVVPSDKPSENPDFIPTEKPTITPTEKPTEKPTIEPTVEPTEELTIELTIEPTILPTVEPTIELTVIPSEKPTVTPTVEVTPSLEPEPSKTPIIIYIPIPSEEPTTKPIEDNIPEITVEVTVSPIIPTNTPFITPTPEIVNEIIYNPAEIIIDENNYIIDSAIGKNVDNKEDICKTHKNINSLIKNYNTPKTSDNNNYGLFIAILILSVCGIVILLSCARKK